jgi:hypothetical protein
MKIEDGQTGKTLIIDSENRALTNAIAASPEHHSNHSHGQAFVLNFLATPTGAGDCFLYIKNEAEENLIVEGFGIKLAATEYFDIKLMDTGDPVGGSDIVPINANAGSGLDADGVFQNGNNITGLTGGSTLYRIYHINSAGTTYHNFEMDIILPKNSVMSVYIQTGTTEIAGFVDFFYHK